MKWSQRTMMPFAILARTLIIFPCLVPTTVSFPLKLHSLISSSSVGAVRPLALSTGDEIKSFEERDDISDRRWVLKKISLATASLGMPTGTRADDGSTIGTDPSKPITVVGAGGKVGKICTRILSSKGLYVRGVTRNGRTVLDKPSDYVSYVPGDVVDYESIKLAIAGSSGVIFAASASGKKKGGTPAQVDYRGVYNIAKACIECDVPKLVLVSAGSVTRPDFIGFKATNAFVKFVYGDRIMDYKAAGEAVMRSLYEPVMSAGGGPAYAVVRPGGLSDRPADGPQGVHVSQGDVLSSEVTREDVSNVCVAALLKGKGTDYCTIEVNGIKGLTKVLDDLPDQPDELIHAGADSYSALLDGLVTDDDMRKRFGVYMNDFKGDNVEPLGA